MVGAVGDGEKVRVELVWLSLHWLKDGFGGAGSDGAGGESGRG